MKKSALLAIFLAFVLLASSMTVFAVGENETETDLPEPEIYFSNTQISGVVNYWYNEMHLYSEAEATAAGVPEGFSGDVMMLRSTDGGNVGITLDIGSGRCADALSITFRVWCTKNTKEFRITDNAGKDWIVRVVPEQYESWIEITVSSDGGNVYSGKKFSDLGDANGCFKPVGMGFRFTDGKDSTVYIDSTVVNWKPLDVEPPVIQYEGDGVIKTVAGKKLLVDISAYDEYDNADIQPSEYVYSDGAIDENGFLLEGEHTCTLRYFDYAGNVAELELTLLVDPSDEVAPVLSPLPENISANVGMRSMLTVTATDERDGEIEPTLIWSEGALDSRGRLTAGKHTLTVSAADSSGNEVVRTITVTVTEGLPEIN